LVRRRDGDIAVAGKAASETLAHVRRRLAEHEPARLRGDDAGMDRLAAAVVEYAQSLTRQQRDDALGDVAVMHVEMPCIDVDRMGTVPEADPVAVLAHRSKLYDR